MSPSKHRIDLSFFSRFRSILTLKRFSRVHKSNICGNLILKAIELMRGTLIYHVSILRFILNNLLQQYFSALSSCTMHRDTFTPSCRNHFGWRRK